MLPKAIKGQEAQLVLKVHGVPKAQEVGADQEESKAQLARVVLEVPEGIEESQVRGVPEDTMVAAEIMGHQVQGARQVPWDHKVAEEKKVDCYRCITIFRL